MPQITPEEFALNALVEKVFPSSEDAVGNAVKGVLDPNSGWTIDENGVAVPPVVVTEDEAAEDAATSAAAAKIADLQAQLDAAKAEADATAAADAQEEAAEAELIAPAADDTPEVAALKAQLQSLGVEPATA